MTMMASSSPTVLPFSVGEQAVGNKHCCVTAAGLIAVHTVAEPNDQRLRCRFGCTVPELLAASQDRIQIGEMSLARDHGQYQGPTFIGSAIFQQRQRIRRRIEGLEVVNDLIMTGMPFTHRVS